MRKKRPENTFLSQNRTEKQIMPSRTVINCLFNDIWCYLFIASFDWKIGYIQQTVVRGYHILNERRLNRKPYYIYLSRLFILDNLFNLFCHTFSLTWSVFQSQFLNSMEHLNSCKRLSSVHLKRATEVAIFIFLNISKEFACVSRVGKNTNYIENLNFSSRVEISTWVT